MNDSWLGIFKGIAKDKISETRSRIGRKIEGEYRLDPEKFKNSTVRRSVFDAAARLVALRDDQALDAASTLKDFYLYVLGQVHGEPDYFFWEAVFGFLVQRAVLPQVSPTIEEDLGSDWPPASAEAIFELMERGGDAR
jgi:hypothetical protein